MRIRIIFNEDDVVTPLRGFINVILDRSCPRLPVDRSLASALTMITCDPLTSLGSPDGIQFKIGPFMISEIVLADKPPENRRAKRMAARRTRHF